MVDSSSSPPASTSPLLPPSSFSYDTPPSAPSSSFTFTSPVPAPTGSASSSSSSSSSYAPRPRGRRLEGEEGGYASMSLRVSTPSSTDETAPRLAFRRYFDPCPPEKLASKGMSKSKKRVGGERVANRSHKRRKVEVKINTGGEASSSSSSSPPVVKAVIDKTPSVMGLDFDRFESDSDESSDDSEDDDEEGEEEMSLNEEIVVVLTANNHELSRYILDYGSKMGVEAKALGSVAKETELWHDRILPFSTLTDVQDRETLKGLLVFLRDFADEHVAQTASAASSLATVSVGKGKKRAAEEMDQ